VRLSQVFLWKASLCLVLELCVSALVTLFDLECPNYISEASCCLVFMCSYIVRAHYVTCIGAVHLCCCSFKISVIMMGRKDSDL
jgi:hypothetical protein